MVITIVLCCCLCRHIDTLSGRVHGWDRGPPRSVSDSSPRLSWGVGTASSACKRASTRALPKRDRTSEQAARYSLANSNRQCRIISLLTTISKNLFCNFSFCNYFVITILIFESYKLLFDSTSCVLRDHFSSSAKLVLLTTFFD